MKRILSWIFTSLTAAVSVLLLGACAGLHPADNTASSDRKIIFETTEAEAEFARLNVVQHTPADFYSVSFSMKDSMSGDTCFIAMKRIGCIHVSRNGKPCFIYRNGIAYTNQGERWEMATDMEKGAMLFLLDRTFDLKKIASKIAFESKNEKEGTVSFLITLRPEYRLGEEVRCRLTVDKDGRIIRNDMLALNGTQEYYIFTEMNQEFMNLHGQLAFPQKTVSQDEVCRLRKYTCHEVRYNPELPDSLFKLDEESAPANENSEVSGNSPQKQKNNTISIQRTEQK